MLGISKMQEAITNPTFHPKLASFGTEIKILLGYDATFLLIMSKKIVKGMLNNGKVLQPTNDVDRRIILLSF